MAVGVELVDVVFGDLVAGWRVMTEAWSMPSERVGVV